MAIIQRNFCELANHVEICRTANIYWAFRKNNLLVLSKRREFSGMIHRLTYQFHNPSNPQQPIHSLRLAPVRMRRKSWWDFFLGSSCHKWMIWMIWWYGWWMIWMAWWILLKKHDDLLLGYDWRWRDDKIGEIVGMLDHFFFWSVGVFQAWDDSIQCHQSYQVVLRQGNKWHKSSPQFTLW